MGAELRLLTSSEIDLVAGGGVIREVAAGVGGLIGGGAGTRSGAQVGAEIGGALSSVLGPEAALAGVAIGYMIGKKYGEVIGTAGGIALGSLIGLAIEEAIAHGASWAQYLGQMDLPNPFGNWFHIPGIDLEGAYDSAEFISISTNLDHEYLFDLANLRSLSTIDG